MADEPDNGVRINLISSRKLDSMSSEEKLRFILDQVKNGTVLVLERGLSAVEEIDLIKSTMSEIDHETFIGIEMQSYSSDDLTTRTWLSRVLGRSRVPKMSVIGPANLLKTIQKNGNIIQAMILTGKSIQQGTAETVTPESGEVVPNEEEEAPGNEMGDMGQDHDVQEFPEEGQPTSMDSEALPEQGDEQIAQTQQPPYEPSQSYAQGENPEMADSTDSNENNATEDQETNTQQPEQELDQVTEQPNDQPLQTQDIQIQYNGDVADTTTDTDATQSQLDFETINETEPENLGTPPEEEQPVPDHEQENESDPGPEQEPEEGSATTQTTEITTNEQEDEQVEEQEPEPESESESEPGAEHDPDAQQNTGFLYKRLKTEEE